MRLHTLLYEHVHFEGLVSFFLAVADTKQLRLAFSSEGITVDTIDMTLAEQQVW